MRQKTFQALPDDRAATEVDKKYIRRAYEIAKNAVLHGNPPFGALLVYAGNIIAEFENAVITSKDVTKHAETGLVSLTSQKFSGEILSQSTLYTSTEPCVMCCGAILAGPCQNGLWHELQPHGEITRQRYRWFFLSGNLFQNQSRIRNCRSGSGSRRHQHTPVILARIFKKSNAAKSTRLKLKISQRRQAATKKNYSLKEMELSPK